MTNWMSVKNKSPEANGTYQVFENGLITEAVYMSGSWIKGYYNNSTVNVTQWKNLPEAPKYEIIFFNSDNEDEKQDGVRPDSIAYCGSSENIPDEYQEFYAEILDTDCLILMVK